VKIIVACILQLITTYVIFDYEAPHFNYLVDVSLEGCVDLFKTKT